MSRESGVLSWPGSSCSPGGGAHWSQCVGWATGDRGVLTLLPLGPGGPLGPWGPEGPRAPGKPGAPAMPGAPCGKQKRLSPERRARGRWQGGTGAALTPTGYVH